MRGMSIEFQVVSLHGMLMHSSYPVSIFWLPLSSLLWRELSTSILLVTPDMETLMGKEEMEADGIKKLMDSSLCRCWCEVTHLLFQAAMLKSQIILGTKTSLSMFFDIKSEVSADIPDYNIRPLARESPGRLLKQAQKIRLKFLSKTALDDALSEFREQRLNLLLRVVRLLERTSLVIPLSDLFQNERASLSIDRRR